MKGITAFESMGEIDPRFILEAAPDAVVSANNQARSIRVAAVAATVALLSAVVVIGAGILLQSRETPPVVPPVCETVTGAMTLEPIAPDGTLPEDTLPETASPEPNESHMAGSFSTPDYEVSVIDGTCYMNFTAGNEAETGNAQGDPSFGGESNYLIFSSLAEMKRKLKNNQLSADEMETIKKYFKKTENGFEICNVDNLMTAVLPDGWYSRKVSLYGALYSRSVGGTIPAFGIVDLSYEDRWDAAYADEVALIESKTNIRHTTGTFDGLPCEVYTYTTSTSDLKTVFLTIPGEDGRADTHVLLIYVLDTAFPDSITVSDTVPLHLYIYGEAYGTYYEYTLLHLSDAPTVEWLSSFSIEPYVEEDTSAAS